MGFPPIPAISLAWKGISPHVNLAMLISFDPLFSFTGYSPSILN